MMALTSEAGVSVFLGSQVFLGLWDKKKNKTRGDPRARNSIWWGHGSRGLLERLSPEEGTKAVAMGRLSNIRGCWRAQISAQPSASGRVSLE